MRGSASRVGLWQQCQAWARDDAQWTPEPANDGFGFGTRIHSACENYIEENRLPSLDDLKDDVFAAVWASAKAWIDEHAQPSWEAEVKVYYDVLADTARLVQARGHRNYEGLAASELPGTADVVWVEDETLHVLDWKTGRDIEYARPQLATLALAFARAFNTDRAVAHIVQLGEGEVRETLIDYDMFQLATIQAQLKQLYEETPGAEPIPGAHCVDLYCPMRLTCPETVNAAEQLVPPDALAKQYRMSLAIEGPDHAGWMLHRVNMIRDAAETLRDALKDYARQNGGIPSSAGKVWRELTSNRSQFDKEKALGLLKSLGASNEQLASLTYTAPRREFREVKA